MREIQILLNAAFKTGDLEGEERERDGHVDLANAAFLTCCDEMTQGDLFG
jgi:hypothetical protein